MPYSSLNTFFIPHSYSEAVFYTKSVVQKEAQMNKIECKKFPVLQIVCSPGAQ